MSWLKRFGTYVLVFLLSGGWFSLYQPWGAFLDPDGFTHAKIATLLWQRGFLQDFPWLDLTILHAAFVDQHLGLHLLELPFIQVWGMLPGAQIAGVVFAALAVTIFYGIASWVGARKPWLWTFLLATASPFIVRMSLAKSSPLAIACFLVGMAAFIKGRKRIALLAGLVFSIVHGGWLLLLVSQSLVIGAMLGWNLLRALVGKIRNVSHIPQANWKTSLGVFVATTAGCLMGVLFHPNTRNFFRFLWVQVGVIGIQTPFERVRLGEEWRSITVGQLLVTIPLFILITAISLFLVRRARTETRGEEMVKTTKPLEARLFFPIVTLFLAALTLKSKRYGEYFIPTLALTGAFFEAVLRLEISTYRTAWKAAGRRTKISLSLIAILLLTSSAIDLKDTYVSLHQNILPFTYVDAPMKALAAVAVPGERVFHPQWDLFPELFVANDRLRYISGMDPTYLFVASTTRSDIYADFVVDQATSTDAYTFIHENLGANYIIYERTRNVNFEKRLEKDARFELFYEDPKFRVYRIQTSPTKKLSTG